MNTDPVSYLASLISYIASMFALIASVTLPEWVGVTSILVAVVGLGITWYYKHKMLQVAEQRGIGK
tara:strand:+ start:4025 stop:4222 length:198 start_codon:yes stop_codon:yes gene_type:complete